MPNYVSLSNVFIDDILMSDGKMYIGVLGGAGVHAMAGARVWSESLGLIANIGLDFEKDFLILLKELGLDISMLHKGQEKTTRAWQIFQPDEERIEIFRDKNNLVHQISLSEINIPNTYKNAKGYHFHFSGTLEKVLENLHIIHCFHPDIKIVMEPTVSEIGWGKIEFSKILPLVDVFSPNLIEGQEITGNKIPEKIVVDLVNWGANCVALRMGEQGSLLLSKGHEFAWIPPVSAKIVDVTGAGNAYLGGMLVGLCEGDNFIDAALKGAVSASFAIEQFGVRLFDQDCIPEREIRFSIVKKQLNELMKRE
ncbi:MAG TPA: hypothetical protein DDX29_11955 [Clostridiales bacterium]|nr:hypothetical protein [Clostridiales bacterium]